MSKKELLQRIVDSPVDRRNFMKRAGSTSLGVAAMTMMGGSLGKLQAATYSDVDISKPRVPGRGILFRGELQRHTGTARSHSSLRSWWAYLWRQDGQFLGIANCLHRQRIA